MQTTQLAVNTENLIQHLRFSFTQSTTVLAELMQNARRAGADFVNFDYDQENRTLIVTDNGCGIACLNTLLTVAESGWDAAMIEREQPYGMGFLSALFACEAITVDSQSGRISATTADVLAFKPVQIEPTHEQGLTCLTLSQFKPEAACIEAELKRLARGFPIEVCFNGVHLERSHALTSGLSFIHTELGELYLQGASDGEDWRQHSDEVYLYLQGLPVYRRHETRDQGHVVHLDSRRFRARLPDRDKLIDEAAVLAEVKQVIAREARRHLESIKAQRPMVEFVAGYDTLEAYHCLDLLNDVPLLPKPCLAVIEDYPVKEGHCHFNLATEEKFVTREAVESGLIKIAELDDLDDVGAARWLYAWYRGFRLLRSGLDRRHWLFDYVIDLNAPAIRLDIIGEQHRAYFEGQWVGGQAVFCERYRLTLGDDGVDIDQHAIYDEDQNQFIVPSKETSGLVVAQASSYHDEWDTYIESAKEADEWDFQKFVVANTAPNPAAALQRLLPSFASCPALFSRSFQVLLGDQGEVVMVAEV